MQSRITHSGAVISLIFVAVIWGVSFPTVQYALRAGMGVSLFMALRFALGSLGLGLICLICKTRFSRLLLLESTALGTLNFAAFWLQTDGLRFTTNAKAAFVTTLYVLITPLMALGLGDRLRRSEAIAIPVAVLGLAGLFWTGAGLLSAWGRGDSEILGCAFLFAAMILAVDRMSRRHDILAMTFVQLLVMAVLSALLLLIAPPQDLNSEWRSAQTSGVLLSLGFNGLVSTAFAFWVQSLMQSRLGATESAILFSLEPVFATLLAVSGWLPGIHETMTPLQCAGGSLIIGAALLAASRSGHTVLTPGERGPVDLPNSPKPPPSPVAPRPATNPQRPS